MKGNNVRRLRQHQMQLLNDWQCLPVKVLDAFFQCNVFSWEEVLYRIVNPDRMQLFAHYFGINKNCSKSNSVSLQES